MSAIVSRNIPHPSPEMVSWAVVWGADVRSGVAATHDVAWDAAIAAALLLAPRAAGGPRLRGIELTVGDSEPAILYPGRTPDGAYDAVATRAVAECLVRPGAGEHSPA